jgi:hypothetical protein
VTRKLNCWEFKNCGREKGGLMVKELGECPVAAAMQCDGMNEGFAAGRVCWTLKNVSNRLMHDSNGFGNPCHACEFYKRVMHEEEDKAQFRYSSALV